MLIKRLEIKILEACEWNFGYSPRDDPWFDEVLKQRNRLSDFLYKNDKVWHELYRKCEMKNSIKELKKLPTWF